MKFTKKILVETLNKKSNGEKTFTDGKKQNIIIIKENKHNQSRPVKIKKSCYYKRDD